jgi:uncharacterized membrane-anchored protein YitT (DUF2179 family)
MTKTFVATVITFNIVMSFLFFLSSQLTFLFVNEREGIANVGITNITVGTARGLVELYPNLPFFVLLFSLIVNAFFVIILLRDKETQQTLLAK